MVTRIPPTMQSALAGGGGALARKAKKKQAYPTRSGTERNGLGEKKLND